jgi:hypothetical protein
MLSYLILIAGCVMKPAQIKENQPPRYPVGTIAIKSSDTVLRSIFCDNLKSRKLALQIKCGNEKSLKENVELLVEMKILNESNDLTENIITSLKYLTILISVSSSAIVKFDIELKNQYHIKKISKTSPGKAGVWAIQPPLMGFMGTLVGTVLNGDKSPENLMQHCKKSVPGSELFSSDNCQAYHSLLTDSINKFWSAFEVQLLTFMMKKNVKTTQ